MTKGKGRRKYEERFKRDMARLVASRGERTVASIAAEHSVSENLLFAWRKKYAGEKL